MKYEIQECIGSRIRVISRTIDGIYRKHLEGTNITENQLNLMMALHHTKEIEQIELGRLLRLERSSLSRNLNRLIEQGFIVKKGIINRPRILLSPKGIKKVKSLIPNWERAMDEVLCNLDTAEQSFNDFEKAIKSK